MRKFHCLCLGLALAAGASAPFAQGAAVRSVAIAPAELVEGTATAWLTDAERATLLREVEAQMCFELSKRYDIAHNPAAADAVVKVRVTRVAPTGQVGEAGEGRRATAGLFIPFVGGLRLVGSLGGMGADAEMTDRAGRRLAHYGYDKNAGAIGRNGQSITRIADALQYAEPFADAAVAAMTLEGASKRAIPAADPCSAYGPRSRPAGWLAKTAIGLYSPGLNGAPVREAQ